MYTDPFGREHRYGPPAGWVLRDGQESIGQDEFQKIVARGFQFPQYDGPTDLCTTKGDCLSPLLTSGRQLIRTRPVAPDEPLHDYGLYILECDWKDKDNPEAVRAYCEKMGVRVTAKLYMMKFLRWVCGEWVFVCNQGIGTLEDLPGLAVLQLVVGVAPLGVHAAPPIPPARQHPRDNPFDAASVVCADTGQVILNAATDFGSASSASGSQNSATYSGPPTTIDYTIVTLSYTNHTNAMQTLEILASCRFTVSGAGGGWLAAPRVTGTYPQSSVVGRTVATDEQYAFTSSATIASGATATFTLSAEFKTGGTGSNALVLAWTDAALKYNILKR